MSVTATIVVGWVLGAQNGCEIQNQSGCIRTACIICARTPQNTGVSSSLNVLVQIGLHLNPNSLRHMQTCVSLSSHASTYFSVVCTHSFRGIVTQLRVWQLESREKNAGSKLKRATSACCLLLLSPAELEGKVLGDGGGHANGLPFAVCTKGREGRDGKVPQ